MYLGANTGHQNLTLFGVHSEKLDFITIKPFCWDSSWAEFKKLFQLDCDVAISSMRSCQLSIVGIYSYSSLLMPRTIFQ